MPVEHPTDRASVSGPTGTTSSTPSPARAFLSGSFGLTQEQARAALRQAAAQRYVPAVSGPVTPPDLPPH